MRRPRRAARDRRTRARHFRRHRRLRGLRPWSSRWRPHRLRPAAQAGVAHAARTPPLARHAAAGSAVSVRAGPRSVLRCRHRSHPAAASAGLLRRHLTVSLLTGEICDNILYIFKHQTHTEEGQTTSAPPGWCPAGPAPGPGLLLCVGSALRRGPARPLHPIAGPAGSTPRPRPC